MDRQPGAALTRDEIGLRTLIQEVWRGRRTVGAITAVFSLVAVAYSLLATEIFRAQALVQPREEGRSGMSLAGLAAQFGGLAEFAGVSLGAGGDRAVAIATLKSRALIGSFIEERQLLPKMYPSKWDESSRTWEVSEDKIPTTWQAYNDFVDHILQVSEDRKSGLVTITVDWRDPHEAQMWVAELIERTNLYLKGKAILEGEKNLAYLDEQSKAISQVEVRQSLFSLVETEMKKLMLAKAGDEFALKTIDPAVIPKRRVWPRRALICVFAFGLGLLAGVATVLTLGELRRSPA